MALTLTSFSTALFSTWHFVAEYGVLLDCGDGVTSSLLQKSGAIRHVFISHADRDHLTGLLQLLQLNAQKGELTVYFPSDSGSFLAEFQRRFDPHTDIVHWEGMRPGDRVRIGTNLVVEAHGNSHVPAPEGQSKSLGYRIIETKKKLKAEYAGLTGPEIAKLGAEATYPVESVKLAYSGDTPIEGMERFDGAEVLIHEATFLTADQLDQHGQRNRHSSLDQVLPAAAQLRLGTLVLSHFSARFDHNEIEAAVHGWVDRLKPDFRVVWVPPGQVVRDVLGIVGDSG